MSEENINQLKLLTKQIKELENKIDIIANNQAIIIGMLAKTIDIDDLTQEDIQKLH